MTMNPTDLETGESSPAVSTDGCPDWASEMIAKILVLEVEAGTIKNPADPKSAGTWSTAQLEDLAKVANGMNSDIQDLAEEVEALFGRIARGLVSEGHSVEAVAAMINARIPTGCRLPYCSAAEITDALS